MIDYKIIGKRIQKARKSRKLTQEALAEKIYVSANYLSKIVKSRQDNKNVNIDDADINYIRAFFVSRIERNIFQRRSFQE